MRKGARKEKKKESSSETTFTSLIWTNTWADVSTVVTHPIAPNPAITTHERLVCGPGCLLFPPFRTAYVVTLNPVAPFLDLRVHIGRGCCRLGFRRFEQGWIDQHPRSNRSVVAAAGGGVKQELLLQKPSKQRQFHHKVGQATTLEVNEATHTQPELLWITTILPTKSWFL